MGQKGEKRFISTYAANEENSRKRLKKERKTSNNSKDDMSYQNGNDESNFNSNDRKFKKLKKEMIKLNEVKIDTANEEVSLNIKKNEDNTEPKKKTKPRKERNTKEEVKSEKNDEITPQTVQETENGTKVKQSKKKDSKEKKIKLNESGDANEEAEENGEENDVDIKQNKKPSKRQLKKEKQEVRVKEKREAVKHETAFKVLNYIYKWKHVRSEWKFEKIKQAWLINNLLDEDVVPDKLYPTVLEYFEGCKGMAKEKLIKKAMDVITEVEEKFEESEDVVASKKYQRARQLLQSLPSET